MLSKINVIYYFWNLFQNKVKIFVESNPENILFFSRFATRRNRNPAIEISTLKFTRQLAKTYRNMPIKFMFYNFDEFVIYYHLWVSCSIYRILVKIHSLSRAFIYKVVVIHIRDGNAPTRLANPFELVENGFKINH